MAYNEKLAKRVILITKFRKATNRISNFISTMHHAANISFNPKFSSGFQDQDNCSDSFIVEVSKMEVSAFRLKYREYLFG
jgi:hypothetical protein